MNMNVDWTPDSGSASMNAQKSIPEAASQALAVLAQTATKNKMTKMFADLLSALHTLYIPQITDTEIKIEEFEKIRTNMPIALTMGK
ncbi:hypothetical protein RUND412_005990 [Rhizina undulata]